MCWVPTHVEILYSKQLDEHESIAEYTLLIELKWALMFGKVERKINRDKPSGFWGIKSFVGKLQ